MKTSRNDDILANALAGIVVFLFLGVTYSILVWIIWAGVNLAFGRTVEPYWAFFLQCIGFSLVVGWVRWMFRPYNAK